MHYSPYNSLLLSVRLSADHAIFLNAAGLQDDQEQLLRADEFLTMLHEAGANQSLATQAWLGNQYCWVVWKLTAYEQTYPDQLKGRLLTPDVVLDQLKYRSALAPADNGWVLMHNPLQANSRFVQRKPCGLQPMSANFDV